MWAAGLACHLYKQAAHALHHLITFVGGIFDYLDRQALGYIPCVVEHVSYDGWRRVSHATIASTGSLDGKEPSSSPWSYHGSLGPRRGGRGLRRGLLTFAAGLVGGEMATRQIEQWRGHPKRTGAVGVGADDYLALGGRGAFDVAQR